jgi:hypothetical protein
MNSGLGRRRVTATLGSASFLLAVLDLVLKLDLTADFAFLGGAFGDWIAGVV